MACPKRKVSKARRNERRANKKLTAPSVGKCSHCGQPKLPHIVCKNCGFYNDVQVVQVKTEEK